MECEPTANADVVQLAWCALPTVANATAAQPLIAVAEPSAKKPTVPELSDGDTAALRATGLPCCTLAADAATVVVVGVGGADVTVTPPDSDPELAANVALPE